MIRPKSMINNGQIILPKPTDRANGTEVEIHPVGHAEPEDDDALLGPDEIARVLALMDQVQPYEMTDAERSALEADR